jgi:hypothetical protein
MEDRADRKPDLRRRLLRGVAESELSSAMRLSLFSL